MEHAISLDRPALLATVDDPVERTVYYLSRHPYALVDARRLMLHLRVSPRDVQQAMTRLEQQAAANNTLDREQ
jgi:hypothetical protein